MVSLMATHIVRNCEIYKNYKTIIKNLFDKLLILIPKPGFVAV